MFVGMTSAGVWVGSFHRRIRQVRWMGQAMEGRIWQNRGFQNHGYQLFKNEFQIYLILKMYCTTIINPGRGGGRVGIKYVLLVVVGTRQSCVSSIRDLHMVCLRCAVFCDDWLLSQICPLQVKKKATNHRSDLKQQLEHPKKTWNTP